MTELETVLESALAPLTEQIRQLSERIAKLEPAKVATKDKKEYTTREFAQRVGLREIKGVRYYEERPGVRGPLHGTSSVKESSLFFLKGA